MEQDDETVSSGDDLDGKLQELTKTMKYAPSWGPKLEEAVSKFREILSSIPQELVGSTSVNQDGSVLQNATDGCYHDFMRVLLEHGVDPKVNTDTNEVTPLDITARRSSCKAQVQLFNVFAEYVQLPVESKIQAVRALIEMCKSSSYNYDVTEIEREDPQKRSVLNMFKIHLESLPLDKLEAERIRVEWQPLFEWKDANFLQYLASQTSNEKKESEDEDDCGKERKAGFLELLLKHGVNPSAVTEDITETPLEIAATNVNTKAFDLLAPHYEENTRKKISQLMIWALTEEAPSAAFMSLFESVPLAEVNNHAILGFNLLQTLAFKGESAHLAFLLEHGVDPEARNKDPKGAMNLAWLKDHVKTMAELAKYTEPDEEVKSSSVWELVEKEQNRSWQREVLGLLKKQQKQIDEQQKQIEDMSKKIEFIAMRVA